MTTEHTLDEQLTSALDARIAADDQLLDLLARKLLAETRQALADDGHPTAADAIVIQTNEHGGDYGIGYDVHVIPLDDDGIDLRAARPDLDDVLADTVHESVAALDLANVAGAWLHHDTSLRVDDHTVAQLAYDDDIPVGWTVRWTDRGDLTAGQTIPLGPIVAAPADSGCSLGTCDRHAVGIDPTQGQPYCALHLYFGQHWRGGLQPTNLPTGIDDPARRRKAARALTVATGLGLQASLQMIDERRFELAGDEHRSAACEIVAAYATRQATAGAVAALLTAQTTDTNDPAAARPSITVGDDGAVHLYQGRLALTARPGQWDTATVTIAPFVDDADTADTGLPADATNPQTVADALRELATTWAC